MYSGGEIPQGRALGGYARANALSSEKRKAIAIKAAATRWDEAVTEATHEDQPLHIANLEIPCYVLEDGRRVLHQRGMVSALGMARGGSSRGRGDRLAYFTAQKTLEPFVSKDLLEVTRKPFKFRTLRGAIAYGYEATVLADLCDVILAAREAKALQGQQTHLAVRAELLVRGFARVGIIALVDEATGYQQDRPQDALAKILRAFIAKELQPWVRTFPTDYYKELFRLRGLAYPQDSVQRPQYFGLLTNDIVYKRLAPGVLDELKRVIPKNELGRPTAKFFQKLTANRGYPKLRELLGAVVAIMKLSDSYHDFINKLDRLYPRYGETMSLALAYDQDRDSGRGL